MTENNTVAPHGRNRAAHLRVSEGLASLRLIAMFMARRFLLGAMISVGRRQLFAGPDGRRANADWLMGR